jgi:hypothetical protein
LIQLQTSINRDHPKIPQVLWRMTAQRLRELATWCQGMQAPQQQNTIFQETI